MLLLKELTNIVSPQKLKNIKLLGSKNSKIRRFYYKIYKEGNHNEVLLTQELFGQAPNPKQAYADLKRSTRKSLIDSLFVVNLDRETATYQKNFIALSKIYAASKILLNLGIRKGGISLSEKGLKKALNNEITELALSFARALQMNTLVNVINYKKNAYYTEIINTQFAHLEKEILLQNLYTNLIATKVNKPKGVNLNEFYESTFGIAIKHIQPENTYKTLLNAYFIIIYYFEYHANYEKLINYAEAAIQSFQNKKYPLSPTPFLFFYSKSIPHAFQNHKWSKAEELVDKCLEILNNTSYNYHAILAYRAMLGFHSGKYQLAYESLQMHKAAKLDSPVLQEQWRMIEAWVILFAGWGKIDLNDEQNNFRVFTFINNTPIFFKDKTGNNAAIQILKFLFLFQKERYNKLIDMSTPFKLYAHRYLKSKITERTRLMVRILCAAADEGFDKKLSYEKAQPYFEKLADNPINFLEQKTVEIVPFELAVKEMYGRLMN